MNLADPLDVDVVVLVDGAVVLLLIDAIHVVLALLLLMCPLPAGRGLILECEIDHLPAGAGERGYPLGGVVVGRQPRCRWRPDRWENGGANDKLEAGH